MPVGSSRLGLSSIVLILALAGCSVSARAPGLSYDRFEFDKNSYAPGDSGRLVITLSLHPEGGDCTHKVTKVALQTGFGDFFWEGSLILYKGETVKRTIEVPFTVPQGTEDGQYTCTATFTIYFLIGGGWQGPTEHTPGWSRTITVKSGMQIPGFPAISIATGILVAMLAVLAHHEPNSQQPKREYSLRRSEIFRPRGFRSPLVSRRSPCEPSLGFS